MKKAKASSGPTRRQVFKSGAMLAAAATVPAGARPLFASRQDAELTWLGGARASVDAEVVWGTPWPRGALPAGTRFDLRTQSGKAIAVQSSPLAYWPDGTLKWTGHAASGPIEAGGLKISSGQPSQPAKPVSVQQSGGKVG